MSSSVNELRNFFGDILKNGLGSYHRWGVWGLKGFQSIHAEAV